MSTAGHLYELHTRLGNWTRNKSNIKITMCSYGTDLIVLDIIFENHSLYLTFIQEMEVTRYL